ncbi:ABC transporter permease [Lichenifustis flavocetrariae]|uniref:ABC transporter permease n=1 Tax=Lichenifustis flavocetrariae TaxID=2949735 RepID=A0AA41Z1F2_9HYPH|nr:ABC transporter permease [Lichenifustis flavocetrariae]MCW6511216.1 ABC transporter permease [Lichenifustis flavocetrariae]
MTTPPLRALSNYGQVIAALLLFAAAALTEPAFLTRFNLTGIAFQYSVIGLIALGQLPVILTACIDLSQGSAIAIAAVVLALTAPVLGLAGASVLAILAGGAVGAVNGLLVSFTRIPAFVVTLGTMSVGRGLALTLSSGQPIPVRDPAFMNLVRLRFFDVPGTFLVFLFGAGLLALLLAQWPVGRAVYAVGGHEENARLTGLNVPKVKILVYVLSGLTAGLAGVLLTSRLGTGHPLSGTGYELISISAVIIGGASLFGGIGRVSGVVAGVLLLGILDSMINLSGTSPYLQGTIKGVVVLAALAFSQWNLSRAAAR